MKKAILLILICAGIAMPNITLASSDSLPELNQKILAFVNSKMKKKVGRGECWDLAAFALNDAGATWNGKLKFGRLLDLQTETVLPGDIIQFEGVKIRYEKAGAKYKETLNHHTGIIYKVTGDKRFDMANQNTSQHGRKVAISTIDLNHVIAGKYFIYRPEE